MPTRSTDVRLTNVPKTTPGTLDDECPWGGRKTNTSRKVTPPLRSCAMNGWLRWPCIRHSSRGCHRADRDALAQAPRAQGASRSRVAPYDPKAGRLPCSSSELS
jgi:hypothetical protein